MLASTQEVPVSGHKTGSQRRFQGLAPGRARGLISSRLANCPPGGGAAAASVAVRPGALHPNGDWPRHPYMSVDPVQQVATNCCWDWMPRLCDGR